MLSATRNSIVSFLTPSPSGCACVGSVINGLIFFGILVTGTAIAQEQPSLSEPLQLPEADIPASPSAPSPDLLQRILGNPTTASPATANFEDYRLGPGDSIFINVQRFPDLSLQATLDIQGQIIVPIEGAISLGDRTLEEARQTLLGVYSQYVYLRPDDVAVTLTAQRTVAVTIVGEVTRPGFYPLASPDVSAALLTAGGSTLMADLRQIQIQRTARDTVLEETVDLFTPLKEGQALPDIRLQDGDVITIPRLDATRLDEYDRDLVATSTLAQPEITVRVLNYATGIRGNQGNLGAISLRNGSRFIDALTQVNINPDRTDLRNVAVVRFNPELGEADTIRVNAAAALNGDITQNVPLQNNDVIILDRNTIAQITYALSTFTQPFRDILGFLLFFDSIAEASDDLFRP
ncbi:polysaccharide transporter [filamentous cyanobacterium CCP5]|nr:polysaccharide transporter [filamentous cyanobacterium CCP5]